MEQLVAAHPDANGEMRAFLDQAARELLLLESSDWPFLVTTGQAKEYAAQRFSEHVERFNRLADIVEHAAPSDNDRAFLADLQERDNPFPAIDYREFRNRQGHPIVEAIEVVRSGKR